MSHHWQRVKVSSKDFDISIGMLDVSRCLHALQKAIVGVVKIGIVRVRYEVGCEDIDEIAFPVDRCLPNPLLDKVFTVEIPEAASTSERLEFSRHDWIPTKDD